MQEYQALLCVTLDKVCFLLIYISSLHRILKTGYDKNTNIRKMTSNTWIKRNDSSTYTKNWVTSSAWFWTTTPATPPSHSPGPVELCPLLSPFSWCIICCLWFRNLPYKGSPASANLGSTKVKGRSLPVGHCCSLILCVCTRVTVWLIGVLVLLRGTLVVGYLCNIHELHVYVVIR